MVFPGTHFFRSHFMSILEFDLVYGSNTFDRALFERIQAAYTRMVEVQPKPQKGTRPRKSGPKPARLVPDFYQRTGKDKVNFYWGETDKAGRFVRIGVRGKFWVLALLIAQLLQEDDVAQIAENVARYAGYSEDDMVRSREEEYSYQEVLRDLIAPTFKGTPHAPTQLAFEFLLKTTSYLAELANQTEKAQTLYEGVCTSNFPDFAALFDHVRVLAGITHGQLKPGRQKDVGPDALAAISQFDGLGGHPDQHGVRSEPITRDKEIVKDIFEHFVTPNTPRLVVLHGEESSGKKAIIRHFLHIASAKAGGHALYRRPESEDNPSRYLPVFAIQAKRRTYIDLVHQICGFMVRYHNEFGTDGEKVAVPDDMEIWEGLQKIRELHNQPAVFIITDVEIAPENRLRPHIRDSGFRRLLSALFDGHKQSKIIITTTAEWEKLHFSVQAGLPAARAIPITAPGLAELKFFVRPDLQSFPFPASWQAQLRGHVLVALGALISLHDGIPHALAEALLPMDRRRVPEPLRKEFRIKLYDLLREKVKEEGLLPALTLIALSEDGLRSDTLHAGLSTWRTVNDSIVSYDSVEDLAATLTAFGQRTGPKFLKYSRMVRYDKDEYGLEETHSRDDSVWEFDPLVAQRFILSLQTQDPSFAQTANRIIAIAARRRSQTKKRRGSQSGRYDTTADGSRDIQSFTSLLASIPETDLLLSADTDQPALSMLSKVFTLGSSFDASTAFRYALFGQLRDDVDRDYRMTMVDDEDDLRLHLYLLLFQPPGKRYNLEDETLKFDDKIPHHFSGLIDAPDILELMTTVGLSAFHAQRADMLSTVIASATAFVDRDAPNLVPDLARLWAIQFDHFLLRGESDGLFAGADAIGDRKGHQKTLKDLEALIEARFGVENDLEGQSIAILQSAIAQVPSRVAAWLRLKVRAAELIALTDPDRRTATNLYRRLLEIDNILSARARPGRGMVFAGRTARHYIRFLFRGPAFHQERDNPAFEQERQESFATVAELIEINTARLRRYAGADRVGVLLDLARWHYFQGDLDTAVKYAAEADNRSFMTNVSHNGRLDVLVVNADLGSLSLQREGRRHEFRDDVARELWSKAQDDVDELLRLAFRLKYKPYQGIAKYLRAKLDYIARQVGLAEGDNQSAHDAILDAQSTMEKLGDITFKFEIEALEIALNSSRLDLIFR